MTDTPETDACWDSASCNPRLHAQQLERERDEALHKLELCMAANSDVARIARERDEARNRMADALQELDLRTLDFERMRAERDEARQEIEEWRNKWECAVEVAAQSETELFFARKVLLEIANASHFDNIGNWARNKAKQALNIK